MDKKEQIKRELTALIKESADLYEKAKKAKGAAEHIGFGIDYQIWFTKTIKVVEILAKDRYAEFISYYYSDPKRKSLDSVTYSIQDFIKGVAAHKEFNGEPLWDIYEISAFKIVNQAQILKSIESRVDSVLANLEIQLLLELQDKELNTAQNLLKVNIRAAGSLAGVILENHLQKIASNHTISFKKNPTINDLNEELKKNNIYDQIIWRKILLLGDIRNLCSHKKDKEPTKEQVQDLITGVNEIIKKTN